MKPSPPRIHMALQPTMQKESGVEVNNGLSVAGPSAIKSVPDYREGGASPKSRCSSEESSPTVPSKQQRFYFESDILALKNNPDYQKLLKTLAVLEAQKIQAIKDLECLVQAQTKAEKDPVKFVDSLRKATLDPLPKRQAVAEIPEIEWKGYIESLQQVAKQHSNLFINTRRQSKPLISSLDEKPAVVSSKQKDVNRPASYRQPWTPEEQARFEELLKIYPPESVERKRFQKIAKALGTRTTQQVATHVQKYFIKLAHAGLPVPGRMPNLTKYTKKRKGKGKRGGLRRPSTFFSSLTPRVFMTEAEGGSASGSQTPSGSVEGSVCDESSDDSVSETSEIISGDMIASEVDFSGSPVPVLTAVKCSSCGTEMCTGVYWQCSDCPGDQSTQLCSGCVNSDYRTTNHLPSHDLQMLSLAQPSIQVASSNDQTSSLLDKDYSVFNSHSSALDTSYNYLDPNFYPAS